MTTVGLVVNPAAGRDIRRLSGGATVSDAYAKRRTAECVLAGLAGRTLVSDVDAADAGAAEAVDGGESATADAVDTAESIDVDAIDVLVMPDRGRLGQRIVEDAPDEVHATLLDLEIEGTAGDTRRAARALRDRADAVVVLGGDGTNRDVALGVGDVPVASVSTGTNNVVPTPVDGTVAGLAAALVATGAVDVADATSRHGMVEARVESENRDPRTLRGLAAVGIVDRPFVGTRAVLDPADLVGGVVSRAAVDDIGLPSVAGALTTLTPAERGGVGMRFGPPEETPQTTRAVTVPGVVSQLGVAEWRRLDADETFEFDVPQGVVSADGERELEIRDAHVALRPVADGPRLIRFDAALAAAADAGLFADSRE